ncbi:hypothetical protein BC827DRAFT_1269701 [Russula dissimulans]|nr:hypothetical protein BC827DRAFT_1269701 [Russula dissimulans]
MTQKLALQELPGSPGPSQHQGILSVGMRRWSCAPSLSPHRGLLSDEDNSMSTGTHERSRTPSPNPHRGLLPDKDSSLSTGVHKQSRAPSPSPHCSLLSDEDGLSDFGNRSSWNPHAGLKPLPLDDGASDGDVEVEGDLIGGVLEVAEGMIKMLIDLEDDDPRDSD